MHINDELVYYVDQFLSFALIIVVNINSMNFQNVSSANE